jgi:hypothetical protein
LGFLLGFLLRLLLLVVFLSTESAGAHGIAGNRYFDGTMTFDDPAVADEAIVPMNHAGGNGPSFRTQLLLFLDDLMLSVFGKPLLTGAAPDRRQIAWWSGQA